MQNEAYGTTDPGCVRKHNEDALLIDADLGLHMVADGLGGHAAGEVASSLACRTVQRYLADNADRLALAQAASRDATARDTAIALAVEALQAANTEVYRQAREDARLHRMGCTVVMLLILGRSAVVAHAGDSRAYLLRGTELYQLTEDHSWVDEQLKRGMITLEQARRGRDQSVVTRALGTAPHLEVDTLFLDLLLRDHFLLCSDGLTRHVDDLDLSVYMVDSRAEGRIDELPGRLVEVAKQRGGHDNVTVLTVEHRAEDDGHDTQVLRKFAVMRQIPLFDGFKSAEILKLLGIARELAFQPEETIIKQGDLDRRLMICVNGAVEVRKNGHMISRLGKGDFFGEMSLIDQYPRSADVVAIKPSCLVVIEREGLLQLIDREPHLGIKLLWEFCRVLNQRLRSTSEDLVWSRLLPPAEQTLILGDSEMG